ncbi:hypothetical protein LTR95_007022 [Oleoguttula sp. CCFEE 5521]
MVFLSLLLVAAVVAIAALIHYVERTKKQRLPEGVTRLPGPKGLPIIGSVHQVPEKNSWMAFHNWGLEYGPIYQVNLAGHNHVWISRDRIAQDLLTKRSANYSERPFIPALEQDNRTSGQYLPLMSRNELWTRQRKMGKQIMDTSAKNGFYAYPELESVRLLFELMSEPERYNHALESFIARVTSRLAWGTSTAADELKQRARELLVGVSPTGALGNKLPVLMSLPEKWSAPKAWEARRSRTEKKFFQTMQAEVHEQHSAPRAGTTRVPSQSWTSMFLDNKDKWGFPTDLEGAYAVGMHGIAGALTIAAPMQSFCLANTHYPQYQHLLHEEIDRVCGVRMPRFSDLPDMPVLRAFIRETLRWRPPVPTGIPHASVKDDIYDGHFIPAGSIMHPLEWSISRDPEVFTDPDAWNPTRWLKPEFPTYQEPLTQFPTITSYSQFGYGRRICQGMGVTEADLFVGIGCMAWMFSWHAVPETGAATPEVAQVEPLDLQRRDESKVLLPDHMRGRTTGLQTPPAESEISMQLGDISNRSRQGSSDSAICMPRTSTKAVETVPTPPPSPQMKAQFVAEAPTMSLLSGICSRIASTFTTITSSSEQKSASPSKAAPPAADPTMDFTTLLIAKPNPFKFELRIRDQAKADDVARQWMDLKMQGEFEDSRVFWKDGNRGDREFGWGEVKN